MDFSSIFTIYDFGFIGYIISGIYLSIILFIHIKRKINNIISYLIFLCYYLIIISVSISPESIYGLFLLPFYNFLYPLVILLSIIVEIIINVKHKNVEEKYLILKQNILYFLVLFLVVLQIFLPKVFQWWEISGKEIYDMNKVDNLIINEKYSDAIDILMKYNYKDSAKEKISYLNSKEVKKLYDNKKYEKCIELCDLLSKKVKGDYDLRSRVFYTEYYTASYLELYNKAKEKNDYATMSLIKSKMFDFNASEEELEKLGFDFKTLNIFNELKNAHVGSLIKLGKYYQDNPQISNNKSDIWWYVTNISDNKISLISKKILLEYNFSAKKFEENNKYIFDDLNKKDGFIDDIFTENIQKVLLNDENGYKISFVRDEELLDYVNHVGYQYNCFRNLHTNYIKTPPFVISINENKMKYSLDEEKYLAFVPDKYNLKRNDFYYFNKSYQIKEKLDNYEIYDNKDRIKSQREISVVGIMPRIIIDINKLELYKNDINEEIEDEKNRIHHILNLQISNAKCITEYDKDVSFDDIDTVKFGKPPKNKPEDKYEWIILEKKDDKALLLSKYILNACMFKEYFNINEMKKEDLTWENSDIRRELNSWFYEDSFDDFEKELIINTNVINDNNPQYNTDSGLDTKDNIFILSVNECNKYFSNNEIGNANLNLFNKKLISKKNKKYKDYWVSDLYKEPKKDEWYSSYSRFWLRTQGQMWWNACYVDSNGEINLRGTTVKKNNIGIRPALWVSYKK